MTALAYSIANIQLIFWLVNTGWHIRMLKPAYGLDVYILYMDVQVFLTKNKYIYFKKQTTFAVRV